MPLAVLNEEFFELETWCNERILKRKWSTKIPLERRNSRAVDKHILPTLVLKSLGFGHMDGQNISRINSYLQHHHQTTNPRKNKKKGGVIICLSFLL